MKRICLWGALVLAPALIGVPGCQSTKVPSFGALGSKTHRPEFRIARKKDDGTKRSELANRSESHAKFADPNAVPGDLEQAARLGESSPALADTAAASAAPKVDPDDIRMLRKTVAEAPVARQVQPIATEDPFAPDTELPRLESAAGARADVADSSTAEDEDPFAARLSPRTIPDADSDAPEAMPLPADADPGVAASQPIDQSEVAFQKTSDANSDQPANSALTSAIEQIASGLPLQQKSALRQLEKLGSDAKAAVPACRDMLNSPDQDVRATAAIALWKIEQDVAACLPGLRTGLASADANVREVCVWSLGEMGSAARSALPALTQACSHSDAHTAILSAEAMAKIQPENLDAVNTLIRALNHDDRQVRLLAAYAVAGLAPQDKASVFNLTRCLKDGDERIRAAAAFALGQIGPAAASATLGLEACLQDANNQVRANAELALTRIRGVDATPTELN